MSRRVSVLVAVNVLVFVLLAEALGVALYFWETGRLFYTNPPAYTPIEETRQGQLTGDALHPYFGPIHRPGVRPETNNAGFGSPQAFPYQRRHPRELLVGIFGGSVARQFCDRGTKRLIELLRRDRRFGERDIVPLCFGHEGYKQPQQLLVLAYFLSIGQQLDLAVNIDGFNEVALGRYNHDRGRDVSMPSPLHLDPLISLIDAATMTPEMLQSLAEIDRAKQRLNDLAGRIDRNRSAAVNVALERLYAAARARYVEESGRFARLPPNASDRSLVLVTPPVKPRDPPAVYEDIAAAWASASLLMHDMLAARGVPYVHVLQPNQYFTQRRFGAEEARIAVNPATPFKPPVESGYPALLRAAETLRARERFVDATAVFDGEPRPVYQDDCCHYTDVGNERLAEAVAAAVLK